MFNRYVNYKGNDTLFFGGALLFSPVLTSMISFFKSSWYCLSLQCPHTDHYASLQFYIDLVNYKIRALYIHIYWQHKHRGRVLNLLNYCRQARTLSSTSTCCLPIRSFGCVHGKVYAYVVFVMHCRCLNTLWKSYNLSSQGRKPCQLEKIQVQNADFMTDAAE